MPLAERPRRERDIEICPSAESFHDVQMDVLSERAAVVKGEFEGGHAFTLWVVTQVLRIVLWTVVIARLNRSQLGQLVVGEDPRPDEKSDAFGGFNRETPSATRNDIDIQVGMSPVLELIGTHVEGGPFDPTEKDVSLANTELPTWVTHGARSIATAPGLVEQQLSMLFHQSAYECSRLVSDVNAVQTRHD